MKAPRKTNLINEFLRDHQRVISLLKEVVARVDNGDITSARNKAEELNRVAGHHLEFEEQVLYPATKAAHGEELERKLLAEHNNARAGLEQLLGAGDIKLSKPAFQQRVAAALRGGLKHAESCGTLVGYLEQLPEASQRKALIQLNRLKQEGKCWTEASP